jgi:tRNA-Thr(GGU) m(6)t(6)A37 methyltransferase TsaA
MRQYFPNAVPAMQHERTPMKAEPPPAPQATDIRPGEVAAAVDPARLPPDAGLVFIGRIRTPWRERADCPRNVGIARERTGEAARVEVDAAYRPGLRGLERASHVILLYWMHGARRDLLLQAPGHVEAPRGTFALRSPVRPNPIALAVARLRAVDAEAGVLEVDMVDCVDGTPLLDIKPYFASIDAVPEASVG